MALTFDDLPYARGPHRSDASASHVIPDIVDVLGRNGIPATRFVTGDRIAEVPGGPDLLACWLEAGLTLGNHGATHADMNTLAPDGFRAEIAMGDHILRSIPAYGCTSPLSCRFAQII